jgi:tetratricopeptide (TPR) repeat protein
LTEDVAPLERPPNLVGTSLSLQATIEVSDQQLNEQARCALRALSVFPPRPNSFSEEAALAVCNMPVEVLDMLADSGLLESTAPQRYTLHQTIFDYARMDGPETAAEERMAAYFMRHVETHATDYETLEQETHNVLAALNIAHERDFLIPLIRTANAFYQFLSIRGLYDLAELHLKRAEEAARTTENRDRLARILFHLGDCKFYRDEYDQAEALWTEGLALTRQSESIDLLCLFLRKLGAMQLNLGHTTEAMSYLQEGLALARQIGTKKLSVVSYAH